MLSYAYLAESKPTKNSVIGSAKKTLSALIIVSPFLIYYKSPILVNNMFSLIIMIEFALAFFVIVAQNKLRMMMVLKDHTFLSLWLICVTLVTALFDFFGSLSVNYLVKSSPMILVPTIALFAFSGALDTYYFLRFYQFACFTMLFFHLIQMVLFYTVEVPVSGIIPFLELEPLYIQAFGRLENLIGSLSGYVRFSSVFSEPAHLAQYTLPFLCMKLFGVKNVVKANITHAFVVSTLIVLSTSGFGIVSVFLMWLIYFFTYKRKNIVKRVFVLVIGLCAMVIVFSILMEMTFFSTTVERLFFPTGTSSSKADYRVYRGFALYFEMPLVNQLFGNGFKNATAATEYYDISTRFDISGVLYEYMNAIAQILLYSGLVGFFFFIRMLIRIFLKSETFGKAMVIAFFSLCISSSTFLEHTWLLYTLIIYASMNVLSYQSEVDSESLRMRNGKRLV